MWEYSQILLGGPGLCSSAIHRSRAKYENNELLFLSEKATRACGRGKISQSASVKITKKFLLRKFLWDKFPPLLNKRGKRTLIAPSIFRDETLNPRILGHFTRLGGEIFLHIKFRARATFCPGFKRPRVGLPRFCKNISPMRFALPQAIKITRVFLNKGNKADPLSTIILKVGSKNCTREPTFKNGEADPLLL